MTLKATGIRAAPTPRLAANAMDMGQAVEGQAASGIGQMAKLNQARAEMNQEITGANKSGLAKLGSAAGGVVGGVVGTVYGGPAGGYAGAMIGSAAGGLLGGMM